MKTIILIVLLTAIPVIGNSQNATITIGRGTDCFGRGACSINTENTENYNATLFRNSEGLTILRIHRNKLNQHEENRLLGKEITPLNMSLLKFEMLESISFVQEVRQLTSSNPDDQISGMEKGLYPTEITDQFIDIVIAGH